MPTKPHNQTHSRLCQGDRFHNLAFIPFKLAKCKGWLIICEETTCPHVRTLCATHEWRKVKTQCQADVVSQVGSIVHKA